MPGRIPPPPPGLLVEVVAAADRLASWAAAVQADAFAVLAEGSNDAKDVDMVERSAGRIVSVPGAQPSRRWLRRTRRWRS
jgi:hypothetical protein